MALEPAVYWRITDNWLELNLRFLVPERGILPIKDAMFREILAKLDEAHIGIASGTYEIVGVPPIRIVDARTSGREGGSKLFLCWLEQKTRRI